MSADGESRLFAYGTLLVAAVRDGLCGRALPGRAARLDGYARHALRGEVYPAIVATPGAHTEGLLCEGMDAALWRVLDEWESPHYRRVAVQVRSAPGVVCGARAYVLAPGLRHLLDAAPWSLEDFTRLHLDAYVTRWVGTWR